MPVLRAGMGSFKFSVDSIYVSSVRTHMLVANLLTTCFKDSNCTSRFLYSEVPFLFHSAEIRMCFQDSCSTIFGWDFCLSWDPDVPHSQLSVCFLYLGNVSVLSYISNIYLALYWKEMSIQALPKGWAKTTRSWLWPIPSSPFRRLSLQQNTFGIAPRAVGTHKSCHHDWSLI